MLDWGMCWPHCGSAARAAGAPPFRRLACHTSRPVGGGGGEGGQPGDGGDDDDDDDDGDDDGRKLTPSSARPYPQ